MTEVNCVDVERLGNVLEYPADHPVRAHVETCPRCRTLLENYRAFLSAEAIPEADLAGARSRLDAALRARASAETPAQPQTPFRMKRAWWRGLLRPMPALATAVVVVAAAFLLTRNDRTAEPPALRDDGSGASAWRPSDPVAQADGSVVLSWRAVPGADAYEVRVFGPTLDMIARVGPVAETSLALDRSMLPGDLAAGVELTWRVVALRSGSELAASDPRSVRVP